MARLVKDMKVVVIFGSPHRGNTYRACEEFIENVKKESEAEFEYIWLKDIDMKPCRGCYVCFQEGEAKCPLQDDIRAIVRKMDEADGVVFASPVYSNNISGLMKTFIDRISYIGHRPRFHGKKAYFIATTGMFGTRKALKDMSFVAGGMWGFDVVGQVGVVTKKGEMPRDRVMHNSKLLARAARRYAHALQLNKPKRPSLLEVIMFHWAKGAISQMEEASPIDYRYWYEKGWLSRKARHYTAAPVNPLYLGVGKLFETLLRRRTRRELMGVATTVAVPND